MNDLFEIETPRFCHWIKEQWGIDPKGVHPEFDIQGSPERTLSRCVMEDGLGRFFLLEKFPPKKFPIRHQVSQTINHLNHQGLEAALACEKTIAGQYLPFYGPACFQVTRFIDSTGVERPGWLSAVQIGTSMADFLVRMDAASCHILEEISFSPFSIKTYILQLFSEMRIHDTEMYDRYAPFLAFLEQEFMDAHDRLSLKFCHGDFHPLNVIWNHFQIRAVIDWEFTGLKPDVYDAANLVGCAGIENPEGLAMPMVTTFLSRIRSAGIISDLGWHYFPEYILALRFAWLSEWLRKKDREMLDMEAAYMDILVRHMTRLREIWEINR